jgi:hypothetical protein
MDVPSGAGFSLEPAAPASGLIKVPEVVGDSRGTVSCWFKVADSVDVGAWAVVVAATDAVVTGAVDEASVGEVDDVDCEHAALEMINVKQMSRNDNLFTVLSSIYSI